MTNDDYMIMGDYGRLPKQNADAILDSLDREEMEEEMAQHYTDGEYVNEVEYAEPYAPEYTTKKFKVGDYVEVRVSDKDVDFAGDFATDNIGLKTFISGIEHEAYILEGSESAHYTFYDFMLVKAEFKGMYKFIISDDYYDFEIRLNKFLTEYPNYSPCKEDSIYIPVHESHCSVLLKRMNGDFCTVKE